jgi:hypothetical protein
VHLINEGELHARGGRLVKSEELPVEFHEHIRLETEIVGDLPGLICPLGLLLLALYELALSLESHQAISGIEVGQVGLNIYDHQGAVGGVIGWYHEMLVLHIEFHVNLVEWIEDEHVAEQQILPSLIPGTRRIAVQRLIIHLLLRLPHLHLGSVSKYLKAEEAGESVAPGCLGHHLEGELVWCQVLAIDGQLPQVGCAREVSEGFSI